MKLKVELKPLADPCMHIEIEFFFRRSLNFDIYNVMYLFNFKEGNVERKHTSH